MSLLSAICSCLPENIRNVSRVPGGYKLNVAPQDEEIMCCYTIARMLHLKYDASSTTFIV